MAASLDASPRLGRPCSVLRMTAVATAAVAAAVLYVPVFTRLVAQWIADEDAAYGAVVAGAAALLFVQRRSRVQVLPRRGSNLGGVILAGGCLIYVLGTLAADVFLVRLSLPMIAVATAWFLAGPDYVRALAAPFALCFVAIPLPSAIVTEVTMPLQLMASQVAAAVLGGVGIPVVRDGNVLTLNYITLQVAEACSGMRSLVTLAALVAVYAAVRELPVRRIVLLAAITVPVALVGNGLRVAVTAMLAGPLGVAATRGAMHDATGWFAFVLMALALYGSASFLDCFTSDVRPDPRSMRAEYDALRSHAGIGSE
jgi:exosortase